MCIIHCHICNVLLISYVYVRASQDIIASQHPSGFRTVTAKVNSLSLREIRDLETRYLQECCDDILEMDIHVSDERYDCVVKVLIILLYFYTVIRTCRDIVCVHIPLPLSFVLYCMDAFVGLKVSYML